VSRVALLPKKGRHVTTVCLLNRFPTLGLLHAHNSSFCDMQKSKINTPCLQESGHCIKSHVPVFLRFSHVNAMRPYVIASRPPFPKQDQNKTLQTQNSLLRLSSLSLVHFAFLKQSDSVSYFPQMSSQDSILFQPFLLIYQLIQWFLDKLLSPAAPAPGAHLGRPKIAIIGAGLTGVAAASHCVGHGFDVRIFEKGDRKALGGIWSVSRIQSISQIPSFKKYHVASLYLCWAKLMRK